jgi:putative tricarboxylic transport membrane protein
MKTNERVFGLIWIILGAVFCFGATKLSFGNFRKPGPGFLPFFAGAILSLLGLILFFLPTVRKEVSKREEPAGEKLWRGKNWKNVLFTLLSLFGYLISIEPLGFLLTSFLFLFFLFKLMEPRKWFDPFIFSGISVALIYYIFTIWLHCQFPRGIFNS